MALKIMVMAGGHGERFWPQSRKNKPKQFAKILSTQSMLEDTVDRFSKAWGKEAIYISSTESYRDFLRRLYPDWNDRQFILEPMGRDTAACIGLCALSTDAGDDDVFFFVPADHFIGDPALFLEEVKRGYELIKNRQGLLLLGVLPTRPATDYGYIELGQEEERDFFKVASFKEKPNSKRAEEYLRSGRFLWNAGMFMFRKDFIVGAFEAFAPQHKAKIETYLKHKNTDKHLAAEGFGQIEKISFDFALVEKIQRIYCLKTSFPWDDVGSWNALPRVLDPDRENLIRGDCHVYNCQSVTSINRGTIPLIASGLKNINIVLEKDVIYITSKREATGIKSILKDLSSKKPDLL